MSVTITNLNFHNTTTGINHVISESTRPLEKGGTRF